MGTDLIQGLPMDLSQLGRFYISMGATAAVYLVGFEPISYEFTSEFRNDLTF
jgi:hypothetical protein